MTEKIMFTGMMEGILIGEMSGKDMTVEMRGAGEIVSRDVLTPGPETGLLAPGTMPHRRETEDTRELVPMTPAQSSSTPV